MSSFPRQRDTPTRPPYNRASGSRSPTKGHRQELGLSLEQVIGSSCHSVTRFACDKDSNSFAYTTGAAVVLATLGHDDQITQRFFRANAGQTAVLRPSLASNGPSTPSALAQEMRSRLGRRTRECSPFTGAGSAETPDSPGATSGHAKDKVKAVTAVALSTGAQWLAVGETGYRPRVLVFPVTDKRSTEIPSAIISEHSFGVHAVAFDFEGRLLASLGTINDGFLHIWDLDSRTGATSLIASNKCTTLIKQMVWIGRSLVTVGTRHIKVWRPDEVAASSGLDHDQVLAFHSSGAKPLVGRNCILGDMLEATFTAVAAISHTQAVVTSDNGDVLLLELLDESKQQQVVRISLESFSITCVCVLDHDHVLITGTNGSIQKVNINKRHRPETPLSRAATPVARQLTPKAANHHVAIGVLRSGIVTSDNHNSFQLRPLSWTDEAAMNAPATNIVNSHKDTILGIKPAKFKDDPLCAFITWSASGQVIGWSHQGLVQWCCTLLLDQNYETNDFMNELRSLAIFDDLPFLVVGDRYGIVRVVDLKTYQDCSNVRAHSNEIVDLAVCFSNGRHYVASGSRDRTIQVFIWTNDKLDLVQTLDEHAGAVTQLAFTEDGSRLISCSADRTIVIRDMLRGSDEDSAFFSIARTVNLKSAPLAMDISSSMNQIHLATTDRFVNMIDIGSGKLISQFKTGDVEGGDSVVLTNLVHISDTMGSSMIAGVSSSDKSIRIYSLEGVLLAREWGHTEGVTGIAVLRSTDGTNRIVSTAADGTIFLWATQVKAVTANGVVNKTDDGGSMSASASPLARPPLRKVISVNEISRLRQSLMSPEADERDPSTPTAPRSPQVNTSPRRQSSRLSMSQAPRLHPVTPSCDNQLLGPHSPLTNGHRVRTPSPTRPGWQSPARSVSTSPSRRASSSNLRHESSIGGARLEAAKVSLPHRPAVGRTISADPSKESSCRTVEMEAAMALLAAIGRYRDVLAATGSRSVTTTAAESSDDAIEVERKLRIELEAMLRRLGERSIDRSEQRGERRQQATADGNTPCQASGGGHAPEVLHSVEEATEV